MTTSFDNNEDKIYSLLKDDVGGSRVKSRAKLHDPGSRDHDITIALFFGTSSDKWFNCLKSYFATK